MNLRELEAQAEFLAPVIAAAVKAALRPMQDTLAEKEKQIADLIKRLDELPEPVAPDLEAIAALVVLPEVKNGKDAEPVDLEQLAKDAAALIVLPEVKDGKDADPVDLDAIAALVKVPEVEKVDVGAIARAAAALVPVPEVREPEHGRDALDLEILPSIDESKQYARGTYAAHLGGLWKTYERSNGMRGWECIVDGIAAVNVSQDGDREFSVTLAKSSGAEVVQKFAMPIQIYKGVYRDDHIYAANDTVTWAGSQWASTKSANVEKPGTGDSWVLVVKAGRNGKDLRENASTFDASKGVKL